jgi:hypothetical protein
MRENHKRSVIPSKDGIHFSTAVLLEDVSRFSTG